MRYENNLYVTHIQRQTYRRQMNRISGYAERSWTASWLLISCSSVTVLKRAVDDTGRDLFRQELAAINRLIGSFPGTTSCQTPCSSRQWPDDGSWVQSGRGRSAVHANRLAISLEIVKETALATCGQRDNNLWGLVIVVDQPTLSAYLHNVAIHDKFVHVFLHYLPMDTPNVWRGLSHTGTTDCASSWTYWSIPKTGGSKCRV